MRVAVVGFTGDITAQELSDLSVAVRGALEKLADPKALAVVTREEMALVYRQRGSPCRPDDVTCVVAASDQWAGRLFVRGVVRKTGDGVIVGATLESVRGVLVATAQTPPAPTWDMGVAVPALVRELVAGEEAYRERMAAAAAARAPVRCACVAAGATPVAGQLIANERGLVFESAPASRARRAWRYAWAQVAKVAAARAGEAPAVALESTTKDALTLTFEAGDARDRCLAAVDKKRPR